MKQVNLIQGSKEWHEHRAIHFNASDAPAMLGVSKYKSRAQLVKERATGITEEVNSSTQKLFNNGHRFEALARPLAEEIIGDELSPVTGVEGKYSASFDGITFDGSLIMEHKTLNAEIVAAISGTNIANVLPEQYLVQMEHQLMVSGAKRCLFVATSWDDSDTLIDELHAWYEPNFELRARIVAGWEQFEKDVANYKPAEIKEAPVAEVIMALPAVLVQATGMVTASNLAEFKEAASTFIAKIKTELTTDDDFANAEATVKFCKSAEDDLEATKKNILAQTTSIDDALKTIDFIKKQLADKRLMLDKLVKSEKEARKLAIVSKAGLEFSAHVEQLERETSPLQLNVLRPNFGEAIKGLKSLSSMQEKVDTALRNAKFDADQVAKDYRAKLAWLVVAYKGYEILFHDLQSLAAKPNDDFQLAVTSRIEKHKAIEAEKLEAQRADIQAKEEAKARAKVEAEEREKARAEAVALANREQLAAQERAQNNHQSEAVTQDWAQPALVQKEPAAPSAGFNLVTRVRASRAEILEVLSENFGLPEEMMLDWILAEFAGDIRFNNMKQAA